MFARFCIYLAIKVVVDAHLIEGEELRRRQASLRWGVVLVALAIGFGLIEAAGWDKLTPRVFAILLAATGIGNLDAYFLSNRIK